MAALAIILLDLASRSGLDKMLARNGSPALVALWAQLQTVVELVSAVALAGVLQGLTVMVAQTRHVQDERALLRDALKLGVATALAVALVIAVAAPTLARPYTQGVIAAELFWLAALAGCMTVLPATLNAYWLGKHQQPRMLLLALLTGGVLWLIAAGAALGMSLRGLMGLQCMALAVCGLVVWCVLRTLMRPANQHAETPRATGHPAQLARLMRFVPVGLTIGIMGPVSMLLMRGILSRSLSWDDAGYFQALWRCSEWVTATAAGVLSLIFLPRFSNAHGNTRGAAHFRRELWRAGVLVLGSAAVLLSLIYFNQAALLSLLYDARFTVSNTTAALFLLGCWIRAAAWLFLFGLFAAHRTRWLITGEFLSLPLYALLLWYYEDGMTLERAALLFLLSYAVYLGFNVAGLCWPRQAVKNDANNTVRN